MTVEHLTVPLTDERVAAHLTATLQETGYFGKVRLEANPFRGKRLLRLHRDASGRYWVQRRYNRRAYLAAANIMIIDGRMSQVIFFNLESGEPT